MFGFENPVALVAAVALGALVVWLVGGLVLRQLGLWMSLLSLAAMAVGNGPVMLATLVPGLVLWLAGHWLYAARHGYVKSRLADFVFAHAPGRLHPPI